MYFATDYVPTEADLFAICADMLDVYMDFSGIYGSDPPKTGEATDTVPYEVVIKLSDKKALYLQQVTEYSPLTQHGRPGRQLPLRVPRPQSHDGLQLRSLQTK